MTDHESKARETTSRIVGRILSASPLASEVQHITDAIADALREAEAPLLKKIVELSAQIQRVEEINENLRGTVRDQPIKWNDEYYEMKLKEARLTEREACAKLFKQRLEGLATHARNHIHEDQTRFDIRHKARLAVAEELLSWLATAIRGRNSTDG